MKKKEIKIDPEKWELIKKALKEIIYMARRYADGRKSMSVLIFNDSYDQLRDIFGNEIDVPHDIFLSHKGKFFPYAQDGQHEENISFDAVSGRKYFPKKEF